MIAPVDGMEIDADVVFKPGVFHLPRGISVVGDNLNIQGTDTFLVGNDRKGTAISLAGRRDITIQGLKLQEYEHGIRARDCTDLHIENCRITSTLEVAPNSIFLDIWRPADQPYGAGVLLDRVTNSRIRNNDLQHQMNGLLAYHCSGLTVEGNIANYCSGYGFHLFDTQRSLYQENFADYCCRFEPRDGETGHLGADSAGFLIVHGSSGNIFRGNRARMSGDGFFLSGLTPTGKPVPCNDNLFEGNDGSYSPNIAFEATFSARNVFRANIASGCNYGFWLGFSRDGILENNQISGNRQAGIAAENAIGFELTGNILTNNAHGLLLWSKHIPEFLAAVPENTTSEDWQIENNVFDGNRVGVRIAADQDHGVRPYPHGRVGDPVTPAPRNHRIIHNRFSKNVVGVELLGAVASRTAPNRFSDSLQTDVRSHAH